MDDPHDALRAASHRDPYAWYARLPAMSFDARLRLWLVAGADAVREALVHPDLRVRPAAEPVPAALQGRPAGEVFARLVRMNDGAFHAAHCPQLAASARRWEDAAVAAAAGEAAADLCDRCDADALLSAMPVQAMARLLGVPAAQRDATVAWAHAFVQGMAPGADAAALDAADAAAVALSAQGEAQGLDAVHSANRIALLQQALDATAGLVGNTVHLLRCRPDLLPAVATFDGMRTIAMEVARWDAPIQNTRRFAAAPLVLAGEPVAAGDGLLVLLAAANRDPALNPHPDTFDAARAQPRSFTFGAGPHACPGERVAVGIAAAALHVLQQRQPLARWFGPVRGYRPLANARIPVFSVNQGATPW